MKTRSLSCFQDFHCIAGACRDSCCVGWEIDVDEASFQRYQQLEGPFGEVVRSAIATEEDGTRHYILNGERCPFLTEEGLCRQILTVGEELLCEICDQHPRFHSYYGDVRETGVGVACEEAARLLLASPEPIRIVEEGDGAEPEDDCYAFLLEVRSRMIAIAQDRSLSIWQRMSLILAAAEAAQQQLDWEEFAEEETPEVGPEVHLSQSLGWLEWLTQLEPIDGEWSEALADTLAAAQYPELMEEFTEELEERSWEQEHLLVYLLFRYLMKAYEDNGLRYWASAAVFDCLTADLLAFGRWLRNGRRLSGTDRQDAARIFSKEIEYDPEIIEGLDEVLDSCEPFVGGEMAF